MSQKYSLLFIASQTTNRSNGGMESATQIYESLAGEYRWTLVTTHETQFTTRWRNGGACVVVAPFDSGGSLAKRIVQGTSWWLRIVYVMLQKRPDCVHANDIRACRVASVPARLLRVPLLFTVRDTKPKDNSYGSHWLRCARRCRYLIMLSEEMADMLAERLNIPRQSTLSINSIVDLRKFSPADTQERESVRWFHKINETEFAIGIIGVVSEKKGQLDLIRWSLPAILKQLPEVKVHLIGDFEPERDTYAAECRDAVDRLGLADRVIFHGHSHCIAEWYKALDVVLVGSKREGLARCMIEAMASGVPVVSFDVCSAREMLEEAGAGVVVRQGDYQGLTDAIVRLTVEPEARAAMGAAGRQQAQRLFSADAVVAAYQRLYEDVLPIDAS